MDLEYKYQRIALFIIKEYFGLLNEKERFELEKWLREKEEHSVLYNRLKEKDYSKVITLYEHLDAEQAWKVYKNHRKYCNSHRIIYRWLSVASVIIVFLSVGIGIWFGNMRGVAEIERSDSGSSKAELILSDGTVRKLDTIQQLKKIKEGEKIIRHGSGIIDYSDECDIHDTKENLRLIYNELYTPVGGEYQLVLSDGTRVWLNSQTRLCFPVEFNLRERKVYLDGEAYFEVSRDSMRPFFVKMFNDVEVEVLGTSFNVRAYQGEKEIETVLEAGSVRMFNQEGGVYLKPGMRAVYAVKEKTMKTAKVDTELYTSWRNGQYVFFNETIENILNKLSRWYDIYVFYQDESAKNLMYSGSIRKYETIEHLLEAIELSGGVYFEIKGNTIVVNRKR